MDIRVEYTAQLQFVTGKTEEQFHGEEGMACIEIVAALATRYGPTFRDLVLSDAGTLHSTLLLCVENEQVDQDFVPTSGQSLQLVLPIAGG